MKGNEAEYVIPLGRLFRQPRTKRARRAVAEVKRFVLKHTRNANAVITTGLNHEIWKNAGHIPRRLNVVLQEYDGKIYVYAKGSKQIGEDKKKREEAEKEKKKKGEKVKGKKEEAKEAKKKEAEEKAGKEALDEELEEKRREKREKERAAERAAIKRGTER